MKKNLLSLVSLILISISSFSQLSFDLKETGVVMEDGKENKAKIIITNNSGHEIDMRWTLINSTLNDNDDGDSDNSNNWSLQFCECNTCYSNEFDPLVSLAQCFDPMPDNSSKEWYLTVDPNGQAMFKGEWKIQVQNTTDGIIDTLTFFAFNPLAVNEVSINANVTSFPNPANSELQINYSLTNVSSPLLNVYSIVGNKISTQSLNQVEGVLNLNTQNLQSGMYFFTIEEKGKRVFTQRFNVVH